MAQSAQMPPSPASGPNALPALPSAGGAPRKGSRDFGGLFHKVQRNWQDYGWSITLKKSLAYLMRAVYFRQVYRIYRIELVDAKPPSEQDACEFTFKILTPQNADAIEQIESIAEWMRGRLSDAITDGHPCLVALDGDRVAGFNLIRLDHATLVLVNLTRKLRRDCAWSEHIAVRKEYRRTGLGAQLRLRIFQELKRRGLRRLYGGTLVTNTASLSLARSVGFKEVADVHYCKFFTLQNWWYRRVRR